MSMAFGLDPIGLGKTERGDQTWAFARQAVEGSGKTMGRVHSVTLSHECMVRPFGASALSSV